jgi:hypothetical protein
MIVSFRMARNRVEEVCHDETVQGVMSTWRRTTLYDDDEARVDDASVGTLTHLVQVERGGVGGLDLEDDLDIPPLAMMYKTIW